MSLNALPPDILSLIAQYLDPPTLQSLSLVDRQISLAARTSLFHSVTIKVLTLIADISRWLSSPLTQTVRHLRIEGHSNTPAQLDFTPLIDLVPYFSSLTRLTWACTQQFPEPLLHVLEGRFPSCRLHLDVFRLCSVFNASQERYERALVSSPNLDGIGFLTDAGVTRYQQQQILMSVAGLAPNLRTIAASRSGEGVIVKHIPHARTREDCCWLGRPTTRRSGRLEELELPTVMNLATLRAWDAVTDWNRLKSSTLQVEAGSSAAQVLEHLHTKCTFERLQHLSLGIPTGRSDKEDATIAQATRTFLCSLRPLSKLQLSGDVDCSFLHPVLESHGPTLRKLSIRPFVGPHHQGGVYSNHVTSNARDLADILSHCPQVEELEVPIPRTRGDQNEVAIYRTLASRLPRLQRVAILFDASDPSYYEEFDRFDEDEQPSHDDFDATDNEFLDDWAPEEGVGPRKGVIRHAFIISAIDAQLVESIFWTIDAAKPPGSLPLEEAFLTIKPGGYTGDGVTSVGIWTLWRVMAQNWIVRRNIRDDRRHEVDAVTWAGDSSWINHYYVEIEERSIAHEWDTIKVPFRRVWRAAKGSDHDDPGSWREEWHSLPLAV